MIPKTIHYCWFGGKPLPEKAQRCIASWKKYCPDYQLQRWDETNFDLTKNAYVRYCYENGKWAFLSDYVRLAVVAEHGGIYLDTDVELLCAPDKLLEESAFYSFENSSCVNTGQGFGAAAHHETVEAMLQQYHTIVPPDISACPHYNTAALVQLGLIPDGTEQTVAGARILPIDYMNPYDDLTGRLNITENTVSIHWYAKSWVKPGLVLRSRLLRPFRRLFGRKKG
ncbi:MAG: glycosyl transferase [Oscillospiraceae bacterium]|nr:glycosyl transferase [Oscillospiraceae bacterium]